MGIDLALGAIILIGAIRGWLRGFLLPAIRWGALVGCVYAADPVRDAIRPHVAETLRSVQPELLDRLLWWVSAVLTYLCFVGLSSLAIRIQGKRSYGEPEANRLDQFGGFLIGTVKAVVLVALTIAGFDRYGRDQIKGVNWAEEQVAKSKALAWNTRYQPVPRVWESPPVQAFVMRVKQRGFAEPTAPGTTEPVSPQANAPATASAERAALKRPQPLELPIPERDGRDEMIHPDVDANLTRELDGVRHEIESANNGQFSIPDSR